MASIAPAPTKGAPADNQVVLAECKADDALQRWRFNSTSGLPPNFLYVAACDSTDSLQRWEVEGGLIRNKQTQRCLDSGEGHDPVGTAPCSNYDMGCISHRDRNESITGAMAAPAPNFKCKLCGHAFPSVSSQEVEQNVYLAVTYMQW